MPEVQSHGVKIEYIILNDIFNIDKNNLCYTNCYDLPAQYNSLNNANISIKTSNNNIICCGDYKPYLYYSENNPYYSILVKYKQQDMMKIIEHIIIINNNKLIYEMKKLDIERIIKLDNYIKKIEKNRRPTQDESYYYKKEAKEISQGSIIIFNSKVDSKIQRRLQWSFNLNKLLEKYPECILLNKKISHDDKMIYDKELSTIEIISNKRKFNNK